MALASTSVQPKRPTYGVCECSRVCEYKNKHSTYSPPSAPYVVIMVIFFRSFRNSFSQGFTYPHEAGYPIDSRQAKYYLMETHYNNLKPDFAQLHARQMADNSGLKIYFTHVLRPNDAGILSIGKYHIYSLYINLPRNKGVPLLIYNINELHLCAADAAAAAAAALLYILCGRAMRRTFYMWHLHICYVVCNSCHAIYEIAGRSGRSNRIGGSSKTKAYDFARLVQMRFSYGAGPGWPVFAVSVGGVLCLNRNNKQWG